MRLLNLQQKLRSQRKRVKGRRQRYIVRRFMRKSLIIARHQSAHKKERVKKEMKKERFMRRESGIGLRDDVLFPE